MKGSISKMLLGLALTVVIGVLLATAGCGEATTTTVTTPGAPSSSAEKAKSDLRTAMREQWSIHAWYTTEAVLAAKFGSPNLSPTLDRLLKNQEDIGKAVSQFYGAQAGDMVAALLKDHINIAVEVVTAAFTGDQAALQEANNRWHQNFVDLARFLSDANPNWPYDETLTMLNTHLDLLTVMVTSIASDDFTKAIQQNDVYIQQVLVGLADFLTDGIIEQFPEKFK